MKIFINPNMTCDFDCDYCYEKDILRPVPLDVEGIKSTVDMLLDKYEPRSIVFHGGEPLMADFDKIKELIEYADKSVERFSFQTNGHNITDKLLDFLSDYSLSFSYSMDGPFILSHTRGSGSFQNRKSQYERVYNNLLKLLERDNISVSLLSVATELHSKVDNAFERYIEFIEDLQDKGLNTIKVNPASMSYDHVDLNGMIGFFKKLIDYTFRPDTLTISPYNDMRGTFLGIRGKTCAFGQCNPDNTKSRFPFVFPNGELRNCLRTGEKRPNNKDTGRERSEYLINHSLEEGGCIVDNNLCKYWMVCGGLCASSTFDGTVYTRGNPCPVFRKGIFPYVESHIKEIDKNITLITDYRNLSKEEIIRVHTNLNNRRDALFS